MTLAPLLHAIGVGSVTAIASLFDLQFRRIPDVAIASGLLLELACCTTPTGFLLNGFSAFLVFWIVRLVSARRLGQGDVKYGAYLGVAFGTPGWWIGTFLASSAALLVFTARSTVGRKNAEPLPFAPFLSAGTLLFEGLYELLPLYRPELAG